MYSGDRIRFPSFHLRLIHTFPPGIDVLLCSDAWRSRVRGESCCWSLPALYFTSGQFAIACHLASLSLSLALLPVLLPSVREDAATNVNRCIISFHNFFRFPFPGRPSLTNHGPVGPVTRLVGRASEARVNRARAWAIVRTRVVRSPRGEATHRTPPPLDRQTGYQLQQHLPRLLSWRLPFLSHLLPRYNFSPKSCDSSRKEGEREREINT